MKKLLFVLLALTFCVSLGYAEQSAQTYSGNSTQSYREQQVFIDCYNNSGTDISSNYVVVLDTSTTNTASGSTLGTYITTTTSAGNQLVLGVTDATIANGKVGRVCVRGPHKCYLTSAPSAAGVSVATTTTAGAGAPWSAGITGAGAFGVSLHTGVIGVGDASSPGVNGGGVKGEGNSNYWIYVGNVGTSSK